MKLRQICSATLLGLATLTATLATTATPAMAAEAASHPTVSPNRYLEMLSRDNAVLLLVDHQVGLLSGVRDTTVGELKHNVVALANAARALGVPVIVTATMPDGMWGPTMPELTSALPDVKVINRTVINAWDDPAVRAAIEKTGRKQLIIAGVSLEICASFPALSAKLPAMMPGWCSMPPAPSTKPSAPLGCNACWGPVSRSPTTPLPRSRCCAATSIPRRTMSTAPSTCLSLPWCGRCKKVPRSRNSPRLRSDDRRLLLSSRGYIDDQTPDSLRPRQGPTAAHWQRL
ncbi:isochorismatase family protein [Aeromonas veronii]|uniref:isochorismatase family protein n=1 Tax=Aeromonas veronii TaxID=654 RepID=UPI001F0B55D6|nr:isochorismatase family protein [Aeromonas veronii]